MFGQNLGETGSQTGSSSIINDYQINNILRILTMLEKALNRLVRRCYYCRNQYPQSVLDVEDVLAEFRSWIQDCKNFGCLTGFSLLSGLLIKNLADMIESLMGECKPLRGKKQVKKNNGFKSRQHFPNQLIQC